ncbi:MAG: class I SAM-dependent methyltransferase [Thermoanaerobaculia bacterium]|nr:class I SAM-dependent methyltransferase [Thermoanaerobaculia bacterium]
MPGRSRPESRTSPSRPRSKRPPRSKTASSSAGWVDLRGRRLLDVGCGLGESSVYFALRGAEVTATDLSPEMVELTRRLAHHHGVEVEGVVSAAETLEVEPAAFDLVYAANVLHHVGSKEGFFAQIHRALKPGGRFFSWDPLAYNPVINVYRRMATEVRTPDERPLRFSDVALARRFLSTSTIESSGSRRSPCLSNTGRSTVSTPMPTVTGSGSIAKPRPAWGGGARCTPPTPC